MSPSPQTGRGQTPERRSTAGAFARIATTCLALHIGSSPLSSRAEDRFNAVFEEVRPKVVKIYGAGGFRGLEHYQSGLLISPDGLILTVWSYVLDTDYITVVLDDGRRYEAERLGADPQLEIAVLKIDSDRLPHFDLNEAAEAESGARVLAFSNLFGIATGNEPVSVLHGTIAARTPLAARRGAFQTSYNGPVYVVDAMANNPGAAGGALTDRQGRLLGLLGKELRNALNNTWLNYALPISEIKPSIDRIVSGELIAETDPATSGAVDYPVTLELLGIVLVPDVLQRTPPFIDELRPGTPAEQLGLLPDDLIVLVDGQLVQSCQTLRESLSRIDRAGGVAITILRGQDLLEFTFENLPDLLPAHMP